MADTADLVVLGAYYGTGNKGGLMSIFLMGVWDPASKQWCTVAKCGNGHDDKTIEKLNKQLKMKKISKDPSKVPSWLNIHRSLVPDFVIEDPKKAPVWEITGAEFSKSSTHTADGISIRFPRVTRVRDDKDWKTANDLPHLKLLFKNSARTSKNDADVPTKDDDDDGNEDDDGNDDDDDDEEGKSKNVEMKDEKPGKPTKPTIEIRKRKVPESDQERSPSKKSKSSCKYGSKCYQQSKEHRQKFAHPQEGEEDLDKRNNKGLKDVFRGLTIFVSKDVDDFKKLRRYIIAYDGDLVEEEYEKSSATHIVSNTKDEEKEEGSAKLVSPAWVWKCVKKGRVVPIGNFVL